MMKPVCDVVRSSQWLSTSGTVAGFRLRVDVEDRNRCVELDWCVGESRKMSLKEETQHEISDRCLIIQS